jgi:hypothetical protein
MYASVQDYKIDVKGNAIVVYTADQDIETLAGLFQDLYPDPTTNPQLLTLLRNEIHYSPMLQFLLLKRCTKSSSNLRLYEETMCCRLDSAPEPLSPGAMSRSSPCCRATPRSRIVAPVPQRLRFTGRRSPQDHR